MFFKNRKYKKFGYTKALQKKYAPLERICGGKQIVCDYILHLLCIAPSYYLQKKVISAINDNLITNYRSTILENLDGYRENVEKIERLYRILREPQELEATFEDLHPLISPYDVCEKAIFTEIMTIYGTREKALKEGLNLLNWLVVKSSMENDIGIFDKKNNKLFVFDWDILKRYKLFSNEIEDLKKIMKEDEVKENPPPQQQLRDEM